MGDAEGAGNLAVMALDRHMRSKQVAVPVVDSGELMQGARHVNQAVIELGGNISHLNRTEGNLDQTSNRLTRGGEAVAGNLSETAKLLETTVDRLAQILSPGNLASFNATVNILGRSINADTISRLDQTARMLSSAVAHMHNRSR
jgi:methyl-accepting chemotaxis protein